MHRVLAIGPKPHALNRDDSKESRHAELAGTDPPAGGERWAAQPRQAHVWLVPIIGKRWPVGTTVKNRLFQQGLLRD
jgi:hypothetical protein